MTQIAFVIEDFRFGGVEVSLVNLLNSIDFEGRNYKATVISYGNRTDVLHRLQKKREIEILHVDSRILHFVEKVLPGIIGNSRADTFKNRLLRLLVIRCISKENYDVVIKYHQMAIRTLFMRLKKKNNQKFISWYHGSLPNQYSLKAEYFMNCDKVVVCTDGCRNNIAPVLPDLKNRLYVIENIVPFSEIRTKSNSADPLFTKDFFTIVTCARISPEKGIDTAVEACKLLKDKQFRFKWYLIGEENEERQEYCASVRELIQKYDLAEMFIFLGGKSNPYPYFTQCDLYVQPSKEESFGLTMAEAQICGAAVVATDTVGACALIENDQTGCITEISAEALAEKIYELYGDREKLQRIKNNVKKRDFAEYNHSIVNKFYELIEK